MFKYEVTEEMADGMTVGEAGMCFISDEDIEAARLVLSRAAGMPEPELYHDESPELYDSDEDVLNQVIDIQERMAKGMSMIKECQDVLDRAKAGKRLPYVVYMQWINRKKNLWSHWWKLKGECDALLATVDIPTGVWAKYFNLQHEEINPYFTSGVDEEQEEGVDSRMMDTADAYSLSHKEEQEELFAYSK